ncbi:MAG: cell division protein ZapA [Bacteroidales bacterium]|jgi:cell division protein ZapA (FtsZ GTPase activity inhibitor)|nr:cell division protein ZapA [Bacteroidales bacterium]
MGQKITLKIAGRDYSLTAQSEEQEATLRRAADAINNRLDAYTLSHPGKTALELMSLVALNETLFRMNVQKEIEQYKSSEEQLGQDLDRYLKDTQ